MADNDAPEQQEEISRPETIADKVDQAIQTWYANSVAGSPAGEAASHNHLQKVLPELKNAILKLIAEKE